MLGWHRADSTSGKDEPLIVGCRSFRMSLYSDPVHVLCACKTHEAEGGVRVFTIRGGRSVMVQTVIE